MPAMPAMEAKLTIAPFLRGRMDCPTTSRMTKKSALALTSKTSSHSSSVMSSA